MPASVHKHKRPEKVGPVPLAKIMFDPDCQPRVAIDSALVAEYKVKLVEGAIFDNVELYFDGTTYWCADGFHRGMAYKAAGRDSIPANVYQGGKREAILHAVGANDNHGLKRSNADKRRAVEMLLKDAEWVQWSDRQIAEQCGVSQPFVSDMRKALITVINAPTTRNTKDGRKWPAERKTPKAPDAISEAEARANKELADQMVQWCDKQEAAETSAKLTVVNGQKQEDTPQVAKLRKAGVIPADAVVVIEGATEGEEETVTEETPVSDQEWIDALPLAAKLTGYQRRIFAADALYYRRIEKARKLFLVAHQRESAQLRRDTKNIPTGDYQNRLVWALKLEHPKHWVLCAPPEHGGCGGTGSVINLECPKCNKRGYNVFPR